MKKTQLILITGIVIILLINNIMAYQRLCLGYGQSVPSNDIKRFTCFKDICDICVDDKRYPTHPGHCYSLPGCTIFGPRNNDSDPPMINILSPIDQKYYDSRKVKIELRTNEPSAVYYKDNMLGYNWKRFSNQIMYYNNTLNFKEGINNITFKAMDRFGNTNYVTRVFYVDSKKPKISKVSYNKYFNGNVSIEINEQNLKSVILYYGDLSSSYAIELTSDKCIYNNSKYRCDYNINLKDYKNTSMQYYFKVEDKPGHVIISKNYDTIIDRTNPLINNPNNLFTINSNIVTFKINISEENFNSAYLIDENNKTIKLCTKIYNGICEKKISFSKKEYNFRLIADDLAKNKIEQRINFTVI